MNRRSFVAELLATLSSLTLTQTSLGSVGSSRGGMQSTEAQVKEAENRLRDAMLKSDVETLSELLSPDLLFTNHFGQLQSRESDLDAYRSGILKIDELVPSEQKIMVLHDIAIVSVRVQVTGKYNGAPANGAFRFTRVWSRSQTAKWRVVAAQAGLIA